MAVTMPELITFILGLRFSFWWFSFNLPLVRSTSDVFARPRKSLNGKNVVRLCAAEITFTFPRGWIIRLFDIQRESSPTRIRSDGFDGKVIEHANHRKTEIRSFPSLSASSINCSINRWGKLALRLINASESHCRTDYKSLQIYVSSMLLQWIYLKTSAFPS